MKRCPECSASRPYKLSDGRLKCRACGKRFSWTSVWVRPGKPVENAYIESFNGRFRDECLNEHWFVSMRHARQLIEEWRIEYNTERPHSSLGYLTPVQFAQGSKQKEFLTSDSTCVSH